MGCLTIGWIIGLLGYYYCYSNFFNNKEKGVIYIPALVSVVEIFTTFVIIFVVVLAILLKNLYLNYLLLAISLLNPNIGYVLCILSNYVAGPMIDLLNKDSKTPIDIDIRPIQKI